MKRERIPYDVINTDQGVDYSRGTSRLLGSARWIVSIVMCLAIIIDAVMLALLATRHSGGIHFMIPIIMIIVDVAFLVLSCFANFKFRYSNYIWIGYCVAAVVLPIASSLISIVGGEVATIISIAVNLTVHIISAAMVAMVVIAVRKKTSFKSIMVGIVAAIIIVTALIGTSIYYGEMGVFGQNSPRTVVYEYIDAEDAYEVKNILPGKGDTVIINSMFNGKPVTAIDCNALVSSNLTVVEIKGDVKLKMHNIITLARLNSKITISVDKAHVNYYRDNIFDHAKYYSEAKDGFQYAINGIRPNNLTADEVYVSFDYNFNKMPKANIINKLTPSIIAKKNSRFDSSIIIGTLKEFLSNTQYTDLDWAYNNNYKMLLSDTTKNELLSTPVLKESKAFNITFDNIYRAVMNQSNDTKFAPDSIWTTADSTGVNARYFTDANIKNVYESLPTRSGFTVMNSMSGVFIKNIDDFIKVVNNYNDLTISQLWTINKPNIKSLNTKDGGYIYGDEINMTIDTERGDCDYHYSLISPYGETIIQATNAETLLVSRLAMPNMSGNYDVHVYASNKNSTLISETSYNYIPIEIKKKTIGVQWTYPNNVYDGNSKHVSCNLNSNEFIAGDNVQLLPASFYCLGAKTYEMEAYLSNEWNDKYVLSDTCRSTFKILPKDIVATWNVNNYIYNGLIQQPTATAIGLLGSISVEVTGGQKNAGNNYTATVKSNETNYNITNNTAKFSIAKKEYTPQWLAESLIYNGKAQAPAKAFGIGDINTEAYNQLSVIDYVNNINIGSYTAKASLPSSSNFYIIKDKEIVNYAIGKKQLSVTFGNTSLIYDGSAKFPMFSFNGHVASDDELLKTSMNYNGRAINKGTYNVSMSLPNESNYYFSANPTTTMTIKARTIDITLDNASKVYDGRVYTGFNLNVSNLASTDTLEQVFTYTFAGNAVGAINAGAYTIDISRTAGAKGGNYTINVITGTLTIKARTVDVTLNNASKVYDGNVYTGFNLNVSNLASTDTLEQVFTYTFAGNAVGAINAGAYTIDINRTVGAKGGNYIINVKTGTLTIEPKVFNLTWTSGKVFTTGNSAIAPTIIENSNVDISCIEYRYYTKSGVLLTAKPTTVGEYYVEAVGINGNYKVVNHSQNYTIVAKEVKP